MWARHLDRGLFTLVIFAAISTAIFSFGGCKRVDMSRILALETVAEEIHR